MNFDRFRRYKKWEEMTQAEKIEQLNMQQEYPTYTWHMLLFMVAFVVVVCLYLMPIQTAKINDLYNQTGLNVSVQTQQAIDLNYEKIASVTQSFAILILVFLDLWIAGVIYHTWKWRHFRKRTKRKGEVNNEKLDW